MSILMDHYYDLMDAIDAARDEASLAAILCRFGYPLDDARRLARIYIRQGEHTFKCSILGEEAPHG